MDLLIWRFSNAEIDRLSKLQLRYREAPDALDLPIEECRLRFSRWLVEHGKLSEDECTGIACPPGGGSSGCLEGEPALENVERNRRRDWRVWLHDVLSRACRSIARAVEYAGEPGYLGYPPGDESPWDRYYWTHSSAEGQWLWLRLHGIC